MRSRLHHPTPSSPRRADRRVAPPPIAAPRHRSPRRAPIAATEPTATKCASPPPPSAPSSAGPSRAAGRRATRGGRWCERSRRLFQDSASLRQRPDAALYCGAKVRRESYAPLARRSPRRRLRRARASIAAVSASASTQRSRPMSQCSRYPTITCVAGHSIGGLWAAEFPHDLHESGAARPGSTSSTSASTARASASHRSNPCRSARSAGRLRPRT